MVDVSLIIIAVVVPVVLVVLNLMIMARYLDFQATAGTTRPRPSSFWAC